MHANRPNRSPQGTNPDCWHALNPVSLLLLPSLAAQRAFVLHPQFAVELDPIYNNPHGIYRAMVSSHTKMLR